MLLPFKFSYLFLDIPFAIVWIVIFLFSKRTRKEQLYMSLLIAPLGPIGEILYFKDYWMPPSILPLWIGSFPLFIEDAIFGFSIAGIGAVIYETVFQKNLIPIKKKVHPHMGMFLVSITVAVLSYLLYRIGVNSIYATSIGFLSIALFMVAHRKDLLVDSFLSGIMVMLIMFILYSVLLNVVANGEELLARGWKLYGTGLGVRIFRVPLTEMVWGFSWGALVGPLYEFRKKLGEKNRRIWP